MHFDLSVSSLTPPPQPQNRGAYLEDCRLSQPTVEDGVDEDRKLREGLWRATEEQLAAAVKKAGL